MQFSDTTNKTGLIQDITFWTGVDINKYPIEDRTRNINEWNRKVWSWIFESYGGWQFDDDNNSSTSDLPSSTINLVSGTSVYGLPSGALTVRKADVLQDDGSTWRYLDPLPLEAIKPAEGEFLKTDSTPRYYRLVGDVIKLYPAPNYSETNGLKIFYDRDMSQFITTNTNSTPGFASPLHRVLSIGASLDYVISNGDSKKITSLSIQADDYETRIKSFYSKRYLDNFPPSMRVGDSVRDYS